MSMRPWPLAGAERRSGRPWGVMWSGRSGRRAALVLVVIRDRWGEPLSGESFAAGFGTRGRPRWVPGPAGAGDDVIKKNYPAESMVAVVWVSWAWLWSHSGCAARW